MIEMLRNVFLNLATLAVFISARPALESRDGPIDGVGEPNSSRSPNGILGISSDFFDSNI